MLRHELSLGPIKCDGILVQKTSARSRPIIIPFGMTGQQRFH